MALTNIVLIGANGNLGPHILSALLSATPTLQITILTRSSSKSTYPSHLTNLRVKSISDSFPPAELIPALTGQDCVITTVTGSKAELQIQIANAAAQAGVRRFIPADFGSCDSSSPLALELVPLYGLKKEVREHLIKLAATPSGSTGSSSSSSSGHVMHWTSLVCGHFFDWGLEGGMLQYFLSSRTAKIFDGGEIKWSTSTLSFIGRAVVAILQRPDETRDRMLYIQSFSVTQQEVLRALEKATGGNGSWTVEEVRSKDFIREKQELLKSKPGDHQATEDMVGVVGIIDGDWTARGEDFANGLLGLQEEDLDQVVQRVVKAQS